jgi:hypothetical protein
VKLSGKRAEADFHHTASATIRDESSKVLASIDVQYMWIYDNIALILPILMWYATRYRMARRQRRPGG